MDRMAYTSHSKDAFPLQLPQQTQDKLSFASRHPKAIKGWLKILPAANTGAVSKQVFLALKEINRTRIPLEVREQIIALILPQVEYIMATLQKHFLVQAVVLDDKRSKVAQLTKALLLELTHAYRIILSDTSELSNKKQRAIRGNAYHQAIYYFSPSPAQLPTLLPPAQRPLVQRTSTLRPCQRRTTYQTHLHQCG